MIDKDLSVVEIFASIQGEGMNTGRPAVFIRLAGCNLKCRFCDTSYLPRFEASPQDVARMAATAADRRFGNRPGILAVITGGEPTIQDFKALIPALEHSGFQDIAVETNGTGDVGGLSVDTFVAVAPKWDVDGKPLALHHTVLEHADEFKVVVEPGNLGEQKALAVLSMIEQLALDISQAVWLQPEGNNEFAVEACLRLQASAPIRLRERGFLRVGHQIHKVRGWQ